MRDYAIACGVCTWTAVGDVEYVKAETEKHRLVHVRGIPAVSPVFWTREKVVYAVREWVRISGGPPLEGNWRNPVPAGCPHYRIVVALFGSFRKGIEAAGYAYRGSVAELRTALEAAMAVEATESDSPGPEAA